MSGDADRYTHLLEGFGDGQAPTSPNTIDPVRPMHCMCMHHAARRHIGGRQYCPNIASHELFLKGSVVGLGRDICGRLFTPSWYSFLPTWVAR